MPWPGQPSMAGTLSTAGGLVFTGAATGEFMAFDANAGKKLWQFQTSSGIIGLPVTWEHDGKQYVTITSGVGGVYPHLLRRRAACQCADRRLAVGVRGQELSAVLMTDRMLKWTAAFYAAAAVTATVVHCWRYRPIAQQQAAVSNEALIGPGKTAYAQKCGHCHGPNMVTAGTVAPHLPGIPGRQCALRHHGEAGQEQQNAAVEGHSERSGDHGDLGVRVEPEGATARRWLAVAGGRAPQR